MKVGIVTPYFYPVLGGVQEHVFNLYRQLLSRGHRAKIISSHFRGRADVENLPGRDLIRIGKAIPVVANQGIAQVTIPYRLEPQIRRLLGEESFDILHIHEPLAPTLPLLFLKHSKAMNIGTFHAYSDSSLGYPLVRPLLLKYFHKLHGRIAVSPAAREFIGRYFKGNYRVIPNGVDVQRFSPETPSIGKYCDGRLNILFVGRLIPRKGLRCLLRAFQHLKREFAETRLIVVGSGPMENSYRQFARERIGESVCFEGAQHHLLPSYYATCDIFCAPSCRPESFGVVLLEAMASGKPVVCSNIVGYRYLTHEGRDGLLFQAENDMELARALGTLLADRSLRRRIGTEGRRNALRYSWEEVGKCILDYYSEVVEEHRDR